MPRRFIPALLLPLLALSMPLPAAEDMINYRQQVMKTMGAQIAAISLIARDRIELPDHLPGHASALADAAVQARAVFPEGSGVGETDALPAIWLQREQFEELIERSVTSTAALRDAAEAGDRQALMGAVRQVGMDCLACHRDFRREQD
ncbi:MAG: cytochrome c [Chromatiales bacterium]|nr:cytochrome c [Chromatiales bacterium]